jgi:hypothetical protein
VWLAFFQNSKILKRYTMKKLLSICLLVSMTVFFTAVPHSEVKAQSSGRLYSKTITGVDTANFLNLPDKVKGIQYTWIKSSGTVAGKIILEGTMDNSSVAWVGIDSVTLSNTADRMVFSKSFTTLPWLSLRLRNTNSSAATIVVRSTTLRRSGE